MMPDDRMQRVLVVYRSEEGQTARVAERIGSRLRAEGAIVDIEPAADRPGSDPLDYDLVIVGDSIHAGRHSRVLPRWLRRHAIALAQRPVGVFQVSLTSAIDDDEHQAEAERLLGALLDDTGLQPSVTARFAGALAYTRYGWLTRRLMRRIASSEGHSTDTSVDHEFTDWAAVDRFALEALSAARTVQSGGANR